MPAYKDAQKGTWYAAFYYQDWKGVKKKKLKRGFPTKKEALAWERTFLLQQAADLTMTFEAFVEIYIVDKQNRLRENTWSTKEHIIRTKILPYFKEKRLCDIKPQDVIAWQNELLNVFSNEPENAAQSIQCDSEPRGTILWTEQKCSNDCGQYGLFQAPRDAVLDERGIPQICRSDDGQAVILLCV